MHGSVRPCSKRPRQATDQGYVREATEANHRPSHGRRSMMRVLRRALHIQVSISSQASGGTRGSNNKFPNSMPRTSPCLQSLQSMRLTSLDFSCAPRQLPPPRPWRSSKPAPGTSKANLRVCCKSLLERGFFLRGLPLTSTAPMPVSGNLLQLGLLGLPGVV